MYKIKLIVVILAISAITACGQTDRAVASWTGHSKSCIDGVTYIQFTSGSSVQVDRAGKPVAC